MNVKIFLEHLFGTKHPFQTIQNNGNYSRVSSELRWRIFVPDFSSIFNCFRIDNTFWN